MKKIQLGGYKKNSPIRGYALVDDADFEWLNQWKWYASKDRHTFYAKRHSPMDNKKSWTLRMHRGILGLKKGEICDHRDGNGLNNQRENLRKCSRSQNSANRRSWKRTSSKYLGVSWSKREKKWRALIAFEKKRYYLGCFIKEKEAALAYNEAAKKYFGEFANLNIIIP